MNGTNDNDLTAVGRTEEADQSAGNSDPTSGVLTSETSPQAPAQPDTAPQGSEAASGPGAQAGPVTDGPSNPVAQHGVSLSDADSSLLVDERQEEVDLLKAKIVRISGRLVETKAERERLQLEVAEQTDHRIENEKALRQSQREVRKSRRLLVQQAEEIDRLKASASRLRKKNRTIKDALTAAEDQLTAEKRAGRLMKRLINRLESRCAGYEQVDIGLGWLAQGLGTEAVNFPKLLATIGSDPYSARQVDAHLVSRGFDLIWPGNGEENEDVEVMVVGRSGWDEERLEQQLAAREGKELRVYSQEMFLLSLAANRDMLDELDAAALGTLAADHPALKFLAESELEWPSRIVPALPLEFRPFDADGRVDASPLHVMGYAVGKTHGRLASERHRLLSRAFEGEIPWVDSEQYMRDWGRPRTRRRLWRMANHLGWLARSWKRLPSHRVAVTDWVSDLSHLKHSYYRPWMRFKWPEVRVPGD